MSSSKPFPRFWIALIALVLSTALVSTAEPEAGEPQNRELSASQFADSLAQAIAESLQGEERSEDETSLPNAELLQRLRSQLQLSRRQGNMLTPEGAAPRFRPTCLAAGTAGAGPNPCSLARQISEMQPCLDASACPAAEAWRESFGSPEISLAKPSAPRQP